jgi:hypothetical protein
MTEFARLLAHVYRLIERGDEGDGAPAGSQAVASGPPASSAP